MNILKRSVLGLCLLLFLSCTGIASAEYADGKLGKGLILDGTSQTVRIPHYAGLKPDKAITISAWIKPDRVAKGWLWQEIYRKEDGNARTLLAIGQYKNKHSLCFGLGIKGKYVDYGVPLEPDTLLDGKWHLVCATYDGEAMKFYADGQEVGATKASGTIDTRGEAPAYIGSHKGMNEFFKGGVDDVRLYSRALTSDEIKTMAVGDGKATVTGLAGWWKLDGNLKNSAANAPKESVAEFRGIDTKWVAKAADLGAAQLDIRAAGEAGVRVTIRPLDFKNTFPYTPALIERNYPEPVISLRKLDSDFKPVIAKVGNLNVTVQGKPLTVLVTTLDNNPIQKITFTPDGTMSFVLDDQPVLGLGEGGPRQTGDSWRADKIELDRRGRLHPMTPWYGTGTYGSYNPVPLMVGTAGWGLFIPTPWGAIDLSDSETGKFIPADPIPPGTVVTRGQQRRGRIGMPPPEYFIPGTYDVFVFDARDPAALMKDISTISGQAVLPPKWVLGYQQSHRTLKDETQMLEVVDTFREKQIPLDSVCYLGTGFCPSGWNKNQPSYEFNPGVFKRDPKTVLADMHDRNVKVMVHMIPWDRDRLGTIQGTIPPKPGERLDNTHIQNYWNEHNALVDAGVDAWWPDEGDWFNFHERMKRHELYYTGPLSKQPNVRPWSLHRNGYLGIARWGGWMWPGDPLTTWRTLETHIAIGINHSLSVSPFWNSDIGAFYTQDEYTAELYLRWVQFAAFNSLMRCHGRGWENRLPWAWGLGKPGWGENSYAPPASEMNDPTVEPIAKKYIELRYQLLPYNYTLAWQARTTGMPMMRSLWLHYPNDRQASRIGNQYLWGRDMLIAPVYEKGATSREVYLPEGIWYDWWTGKAVEGGKTITRQVDLSCMPIYVRAGAIIPFDPVRQYTSQKVDKPTTLKIYQGADGQYTLYDDDGVSLDYLKGSSAETLIKWDDGAKRLTVEPQAKLNPGRKFKIELIPDGTTKGIGYTGQRLELTF
jgi:alpha-glucosidase/alpha-D-xyloside xylohydrolase